ncbi:hypothetical protein HRbin02_00582 [Candidatus Calditenuaceae archaeon HR02]|nr:hypothetical protein HRbin02_00582 [Candidatus Calditenuaceae archaeon HR02]
MELKKVVLLRRRLEAEKERLKKEIVNTAMERMELYVFAESELGLGGASLAILLTYIDFSRGINKVKTYVREFRR